MRIVPDSAAPPARPHPARNGPPPRRDTESGQRPQAAPGRPEGSEKDPSEYDDGAWM